MIGLALSGGGSRAVAFHLGCMRALHQHGVLEKVGVISSVSGGSVISALYAYKNQPFEDFDHHVTELLHKGLQQSAFRHLLSPVLATQILATNLIARPLTALANWRHKEPPRRWASRTDAIEAALHDLLGNVTLEQVARPNLNVVYNACELRTGTAFRFSNKTSGSWRTGVLVDNRIRVAHAVTCSAAYPLFLPAIDREYTFRKGELTRTHRVLLTDGGVYENLGIACLEPRSDSDVSLHAYPADYIICCHAGHGQASGTGMPFGFFDRTEAVFESIFRKVQDAGVQRLHMHKAAGAIKGFILPYLGQMDEALLKRPDDFVTRAEVCEYPTNFAAMTDEHLNKLSKRGEQLTNILLEEHCPELSDSHIY